MSTEGPTSDWEEMLAGLKSSDGVFSVDAGQRVKYWSLSAQEILGYAPEEVVGRLCYQVLAGRDSQNLRFCRRSCPVMANARRGRPTGEYDVLAQSKEGADVWVNVSILLVKTERRRSPLVLHLFRDVTERRRVETLARRAVETLQDLANAQDMPARGMLASDLRPPAVPALSKRELQVLQLLASGLSTRQIADNLGISPITARNHLTHLVAKLGARNRLEAVLFASRRNLV